MFAQDGLLVKYWKELFGVRGLKRGAICLVSGGCTSLKMLCIFLLKSTLRGITS